MTFIKSLKLLLLIVIANICESFITPQLLEFYIHLPITFLLFCLFLYNSKKNINPIYVLLIGLFVDIISDVPLGLNSVLFCLVAYLINSYSNTFKLFSFFQICLFFSISSVFYTGFTQIFMNLENFSYILLLISFLFNTFLFIIIYIARSNFLPFVKLK
jgi:rod shape-determining protein MreD